MAPFGKYCTMNENHKKSVATIAFWMLLILFMSIIGSSIMTFSYKKKIIKLGDVGVQAVGVVVTDNNGRPLDKLKFKEPKTGLKPATGELDEITKVPHTISAEVGSEGAYAKFYITSEQGYKIYLSNISIDGGEDSRKEIYAHLKEDKQNESVSFAQDEILLYTSPEPSNNMEYVLLVWLSQFTSDDMIGSTITFNLKVVPIS